MATPERIKLVEIYELIIQIYIVSFAYKRNTYVVIS